MGNLLVHNLGAWMIFLSVRDLFIRISSLLATAVNDSFAIVILLLQGQGVYEINSLEKLVI